MTSQVLPYERAGAVISTEIVTRSGIPSAQISALFETASALPRVLKGRNIPP
jgi:hypothetical protein